MPVHNEEAHQQVREDVEASGNVVGQWQASFETMVTALHSSLHHLPKQKCPGATRTDRNLINFTQLIAVFSIILEFNKGLCGRCVHYNN